MKRVFSQCFENPQTKDTVQALFYHSETIVFILFSLLYHLFASPQTLLCRWGYHQWAVQRFELFLNFSANLNRTEEWAFWEKGSGCMLCLWVIKSNSEAAHSTPSLELYNFLNLLIFCRPWWVARAPASRCSLHWNTSQVMAGSKSLMESRLQTRTQVNIWASVQNIMKKYLNFIAGKCSKQDKMLKTTNKKNPVQMTFTN